MTKTLTIVGANIHDIPSFYAEVNRVFMAGEEWVLGQSLDAFDDMLRGGYGVIDGRESLQLVWRDMERSRSALGRETTRTFLREKLQRPHLFNVGLIESQLDALECGSGKTFFELVFQIIANHDNIRLVAE